MENILLTDLLNSSNATDAYDRAFSTDASGEQYLEKHH